jgi:hypothetical protein
VFRSLANIETSRCHAYGTAQTAHTRPGSVDSGINGVQEVSVGTLLLIVLVLALVGVLPTWNHSRSWGYMPSGLLGIIVLVLVVMVLTGRL